MLIFNFKFLLFLSVFIGLMPLRSMANAPIIAPAPTQNEAAAETLKIKKQNGEDVPLNIELALTPMEQAKGLMFRTEMADDAGMLFVFKEEAPRSFWMKNTLIPLDIIFIKRNGEILNIRENAIPQDLTPVTSEGNAYAVLEINAGMSKTLGLGAGDKVIHPYFGLMAPK